ncbi:hypothetical protein [Pseudomonas cavernae]|nr:hypothetical protein [Pseudomonas cavernae]
MSKYAAIASLIAASAFIGSSEPQRYQVKTRRAADSSEKKPQ